MATRTTITALAIAGFIADQHSITLDPGRQIDWANVNSSYLNANTGKKHIPAGTPMGELLGSGKISPRIVTTNPAVGLLATDANEDDPSAALTGYGMILGGVIYETLVPTASGTPKVLATAVKTELAAAGTGFSWRAYVDTR